VPAGDVEREDHAVADLHLVHAVADLAYLAEVLVAEPPAGLEVGTALVHVQVRPADVCGGDAHQHAGGRSILASGTSFTLTCRGPS
jgi:hypothetical protein